MGRSICILSDFGLDTPKRGIITECFGLITDSVAPPPADVFPATLHPGTRAIDSKDKTVVLLGAKLYLIQFWGEIIKGQRTEGASASIHAVAPR